MRLEELLGTIGQLAKTAKLSDPFVVGGFPRDKALGFTAAQVEDIDITTGDRDCFALALLASKRWSDAPFRSYDDGHFSLNFKNIRLDFSNNFMLPGIEVELGKRDIEKPTDLQLEMFSRDFTVNTLLQPMDLSQQPFDPTGMALVDLGARRLRTPVDSELTIGHDARRILRAIKISLQFNFEIDEDLSKAMLKYRGAVGKLPPSHVRKQVHQMFRIDAKKAIELLSEYKLLPIIPLSRLMSMEMAKHRMVQHLLDS
jgi:tRNA nucleotidyltransferase/poly(A) polymerase